jgi:hypothetical protein
MKTVTECIICGNAIRPIKRAIVAPFLAKRIWDRDPFEISLDRCLSCGFTFYNPRPEEAELDHHYDGYRNPEYFKLRNSFEPWYTPRMNADLASPESYELRRMALLATLKPHINCRHVRRVLDYGGDHGDLVTGLIDGAEAFVYDISGAEPAENVKPVSIPSSCCADLTINSNVLEHVGFPLTTTRAIFDSAKTGSLVFLEVPCEVPTGGYRLARRIAQIGMVAIMRPNKLSQLLTPKALYLMHEHINYFTVKALENLTITSGGRIIASGSYPYSSSAAGAAEMGWTLSEKV